MRATASHLRERSSALLLVSAGLVLAALGGGCGKTLQAYPEELAGVGLVLETQGGAPVVREVVDGGPASEVGVAKGDRIVEVDGEPTTGRALATVVGSLRGRAGSRVLLRLANARGQTLVTITRRAMKRTEEGYRASTAR